MYLPQYGVLPQTHAELVVADRQVVDLFGGREVDPLLVENRLLFLKSHVHKACHARRNVSLSIYVF